MMLGRVCVCVSDAARVQKSLKPKFHLKIPIMSLA